MRLIALLTLAASSAFAPARADSPGPVEQVLLAHRLYAAGEAARDGLAQIAGARLAAGVTLRAADLRPEVEGKGKPEAPPLPDAAALMTGAKQAVEADETLGILLTGSQMSADLLPKAALRVQAGSLAPAQSHRFRLAVDGGAATEIGVIATAPLMMEVATEAGLLCKAADLCRVTLPESGFLTVTLFNGAADPASYQLLLP